MWFIDSSVLSQHSHPYHVLCNNNVIIMHANICWKIYTAQQNAHTTKLLAPTNIIASGIKKSIDSVIFAFCENICNVCMCMYKKVIQLHTWRLISVNLLWLKVKVLTQWSNILVQHRFFNYVRCFWTWCQSERFITVPACQRYDKHNLKNHAGPKTSCVTILIILLLTMCCTFTKGI